MATQLRQFQHSNVTHQGLMVPARSRRPRQEQVANHAVNHPHINNYASQTQRCITKQRCKKKQLCCSNDGNHSRLTLFSFVSPHHSSCFGVILFCAFRNLRSQVIRHQLTCALDDPKPFTISLAEFYTRSSWRNDLGPSKHLADRSKHSNPV